MMTIRVTLLQIVKGATGHYTAFSTSHCLKSRSLSRALPDDPAVLIFH